MRTENSLDPELASTGIAGLDEILGGGLPRRHLYLIEGVSGTGKTTLALQFVLEGARRGERCLYVSLSETEADLHRTAASHGWSLEGIEVFEMLESEEGGEAEQYTLFYPSEIELGESTRQMLEAVDRVRPQRVVIDTIAGLRLLAEEPLRYRRQMQALRQFLVERGCTVLILDETDDPRSAGQPRSLVHGIVRLHLDLPEYGPEHRRVHVRKLRGVDFVSGYHDCRLATGGIKVYPRLRAAAYRRQPGKPEMLSSGVPELDTMLGGGLRRGSSALIMGPAGTGKSTLAMSYAMAAAKRGERCTYFIFDESLDSFFLRAEGVGFDFSPFIESGMLRVQPVDPAEMTPGEFAFQLREETEQQDLRLVIIDSLSGYMFAMPHERFLDLHLHELMSYFSGKGVTTLFTLVQHGLLGQEVTTSSELSYIADALILLRYFEVHGTVRKAVSVFKNRSGPHENTIRDFIVDSAGLRFGDPLHDFQGVLSGIPAFVGAAETLLDDTHARRE